MSESNSFQNLQKFFTVILNFVPTSIEIGFEDLWWCCSFVLHVGRCPGDGSVGRPVERRQKSGHDPLFRAAPIRARVTPGLPLSSGPATIYPENAAIIPTFFRHFPSVNDQPGMAGLQRPYWDPAWYGWRDCEKTLFSG
jgi:hypothetical protein